MMHDQEAIRQEREDLEYDIERSRRDTSEAETRLLALRVKCTHPARQKTALAGWPDECPDCGKMLDEEKP